MKATEEGPDTSEPAAPPAENTEPHAVRAGEYGNQLRTFQRQHQRHFLPSPTRRQFAGRQTKDCPMAPNRSGSGLHRQPASVITNAFGMPNSFTNVNGLIV